MNSLKVLKDKGILEKLKQISIKELKEYIEKYICDDLEVGKKYCYSSYKEDDIHKIMKRNIDKGLTSLFDKYKIHYTEMFEMIKCSTWVVSIYADCEDVSIWENIGRYIINGVQRKNANIMNSKFTLVEKPYFKLYVDDENISLYDYIIGLFNGKKNTMVGRYESEIASCQKVIRENKKLIKKLEKIDFSIDKI